MSAERDLAQRRVASREIYRGHVLVVTEDRIRLPDGHETSRSVVWHPGAVVMLARDEGGRVLFVRQFRYAAGAALLELPAGTLEAGEDPAVTAQRELQEEVGYRAGRLEKLAEFYSAPGFCSELMHLYLATDLAPSRLDGDDDEDLDVIALPLPEAIERARRGEFRDAKTLVGILLYAARTGAAT